MGTVTISDRVLTFTPEEFQEWFKSTTLTGKWTDYYPKQKTKKKPVKKVEGGG